MRLQRTGIITLHIYKDELPCKAAIHTIDVWYHIKSSSFPQPPNLRKEAVMDRAMLTWMLAH